MQTIKHNRGFKTHTVGNFSFHKSWKDSLQKISGTLTILAFLFTPFAVPTSAYADVGSITIDNTLSGAGPYNASGTWSAVGNQPCYNGLGFRYFVEVYEDTGTAGFDATDTILQTIAPAPCDGGIYSNGGNGNIGANNSIWPASQQSADHTFTLSAGNHNICAALIHQGANGQDFQSSDCVDRLIVIPPTNQFTLTAATAGVGTGSVTSDVTGISCPSDCTENYNENTVVVMTATPGSGSTFDGWSGACVNVSGTCTVTMSAAKSVTATFTLIPTPKHTLTVSLSGTGSGSVASDIAGIACGVDCTESYDENTVVVLTATPVSGSTFAGWSGACVNVSGTCTVTMSAAKNVTATFNVIPRGQFLLTVELTGIGEGVVTGTRISCDSENTESDCSETYEDGTEVTLTAAAKSGSNFNDTWFNACAAAGSNPTCTVTMSSNLTATAHFSLNITRGGGGGGGGGGSTPPPGQVLGDFTSIPYVAPPVGQVLAAELPRTGVPSEAIYFLLALAGLSVLPTFRRKTA